jgi:hypothetical protein
VPPRVNDIGLEESEIMSRDVGVNPRSPLEFLSKFTQKRVE